MVDIETQDPTKIDLHSDPTYRTFSGTTVWGDHRFNVPFISHIEGNLWTGGCQDGLVLPENIDHVVSMYPWEQYTLSRQIKSMQFNWMYDDDSKLSKKRILSIARWAANCVADGPTLIHCQAGLNRSGLIAAVVLILRGRSPQDAIALLREKRSSAVLCNKSFEEFLLTLK